MPYCLNLKFAGSYKEEPEIYFAFLQVYLKIFLLQTIVISWQLGGRGGDSAK